ncbi:GNAT family N-acetyltransferase [Nocardia inohanensis]|uniref:GNAT family N-acetyltransferase n=1 Tax=Nocardia inohanensis TaxID=209246 RepID=UPI001471A838|nr:GNAT family N-acetyltransferase [Nocardia inohanensis]
MRAYETGDGDASCWFRTGAPSDELNGVLRLRGDLPGEIERLRGLLDGVPASWHVWRESDPPELPELLARYGLARFESEPLMVFSGGAALGPPEFARIEEVTDETGLVQWASLWSGTPGAEALAAGLRQGLQLASVRYLVWRERGAILGCAAVVTSAAGASIEHIVTRADQRGRGIGTALTRRALDLALESGTDRVVLTASPDGEQIYRRLGFVTVGHVDRYA